MFRAIRISYGFLLLLKAQIAAIIRLTRIYIHGQHVLTSKSWKKQWDCSLLHITLFHSQRTARPLCCNCISFGNGLHVYYVATLFHLATDCTSIMLQLYLIWQRTARPLCCKKPFYCPDHVCRTWKIWYGSRKSITNDYNNQKNAAVSKMDTAASQY